MRYKYILLALVGVLVISLPTINVSADYQGLHWGVDVGARFDYRVDADPHEEIGSVRSYHGQVYVIVDELADIQTLAPPLILPVVLRVGVTGYYANGTEFSYPMWPNIGFELWPIGNWTLLNELFGSDYDDVYASARTINTDTLWGYTSYVAITNDHINETLEISKADGATYRYSVSSINNETGITNYSIEVVRVDSTLLIVGVGVVGIAVVVIVYLLRRKST